MLKCYQAEAAAIRSVVPDAKITTNLMGFYKPLDYQMWAKSMDFISWDNYPANEDPYSRIAMNHDLMRGIKGDSLCADGTDAKCDQLAGV